MKEARTPISKKCIPLRTFLASMFVASALLSGCEPTATWQGEMGIQELEVRPASAGNELVQGIEVAMSSNSEFLSAGESIPLDGGAIAWVNYYRSRAGLHFIDHNPRLAQAAQGHADFLATHHKLYTGGLSFHDEVLGESGFIGEKYWNRQAAFETEETALGEVIAFQESPEAAVAQWMESVYHRIPLLDKKAVSGAYGFSGNGEHVFGVLEISHLEEASDEVLWDEKEWVAYPANAESLVPVSWDGFETPQPPAPTEGFPSGPVFSLTSSGTAAVRVAKSTLQDPEGNSIPHVLLDSTNDPIFATVSGLALYAEKPLNPGITYTVHVTGFRGTQTFSWKSSFTTTPKVGCNLLGQEVCGTGKACYPSSSGPICSWEGIAPEGGACTYQNDCSGGTTCVAGICRKLCDREEDGWLSCSAICSGSKFSTLTDDKATGVCVPPECSPLEDTCGKGLTCQMGSMMECGLPGIQEEGEPCDSFSACNAGLACVDQNPHEPAQCHALCSLAGESSASELESCEVSCGEHFVQLPQHPGFGACSLL